LNGDTVREMKFGKAILLLALMEALIFSLGWSALFTVGWLDDGVASGLGFASGVVYGWVAFAALGFFAWLSLLLLWRPVK
jgi:hypothetical protein